MLVPVGIELLDPESRWTLVSYLKHLSFQTIQKHTTNHVFAGILPDYSVMIIFPSEGISLIAKDMLAHINESSGYGTSVLDQVKIKIILLNPQENPLPTKIERIRSIIYKELMQFSNRHRHECRIQNY